MFKRFNSRISSLIILIFISTSFLHAQSLERKDISSIFSLDEEKFRSNENLKKAVNLKLDASLLSRLYEEKNFAVDLTLPLSYDEKITLNMEEFNVLSSDFILRSSAGDTLDYQKGIYYRGTIKGYEGFCTVSFFDDHIAGIISIKGMGDFNLGVDKNRNSDDYVIFNDRDLKRDYSFECHNPSPEPGTLMNIEEATGDARYTDCVKVYIEGDYALYQDKGGVDEASDYITAVFAEVATLYDVEDIGIEISEIMIWETQDGYSTSSSGAALDQFIDNNPDFNGDLAQLFALGGNGTGGLAYVNQLCGSLPYAYENISASYNTYPDYSWTVEVIAHEMGHNFGSEHTHECIWNGNGTQIDDCGPESGNPAWNDDCYDPNDPILPSSGTVMSYCHLVWSVGIDLALGFGPQPGNVIRNEYNSASCLGACTGGVPDPPVADFDSDGTEMCAGDFMQFSFANSSFRDNLR